MLRLLAFELGASTDFVEHRDETLGEPCSGEHQDGQGVTLRRRREGPISVAISMGRSSLQINHMGTN